MSDTPVLDQYLKPESPPSTPVADAGDQMPPAGIEDSATNVINPGGQLVSVPQSQIEELGLLNKGYKIATPEDIQSSKDERDYGDTMHQVNAGIRGAGNMMTLGAFPLVERAAAALTGEEYNPEEVAKTAEVNPISNMIGSGMGLIAGPMGAIEKGAESLINPIVQKLAPYLPQVVTKIGSAAAKSAVENAMVQGIDETAKLIASDPYQSADTAISNIGFSTLFGGTLGAGFGTAGSLWKAASGSKLGTFLESIRNKINGAEGKIPDIIEEAAQKSGIEIAPEIKSGISENPNNRQMFQALAQSDTSLLGEYSGKGLQEKVSQLRTDVPNKVLEAIGKTPEQMDALEHLSPYESGKQVQDTLVKEFQTLSSPSTKAFEGIKEKFAGAPVSKDLNSQLVDQVAQFADEQGFAKNPSGPQNKLVQSVIEELPLQKTAKDLRNYISNLGKQTFGYDNPLSQAGYEIKKILSLGEEEAVARKFQETYPQRISELAEAKASYSSLRDDMERLAERLHPGSFGGPASFARLIEEMDKPETVLSRLGNLKDVNLQKLLQEKFPQTAAKIKDYQLNQLLKSSIKNAAPGEALNASKFFKSLDALTPEMRSALIPQTATGQLEGIRTLVDALNSVPKNYSNTAPIQNLLNKYTPSTAMGLISLLTGHGPITSAIVGALTKFIGRDVPDAARLAMLKFLGASEKVDASGFKAMVDYMSAVSKGQKAISGAVKNVFKSAREVIPEAFPSEKHREKLDKKISQLQVDPKALFEMGGSIGHYLPEHGTALAQSATTISNYLNSIRPHMPQMSPLDTEQKPSKDQMNEYNNALDIAEKPLIVLQKVKDGTLTFQDINHLKNMYPGLEQSLNQKIMAQVVEAKTNGDEIPYKIRMGLSMLIGQPLDSSMTPFSIQTTQASFNVISPSEAPQMAKHSMTALNKMPGMYQTPDQARQVARSK